MGINCEKKKTSTQKSSVNPVFNEEVVFSNLKKDQLSDIIIQFTLFQGYLTNREMLGYFSISSDSRGDAGSQWRDMLNGKKSIAWWHKLISPVDFLQNNNNNNQSSSQPFTSSNVRKMSNKINLSSLKIKPLSMLVNNTSSSTKQSISD